MAVGDITFYNKFKQAMVDGDAGGVLSSFPIDFNLDDIQLAVMAPAYTPDTGDATIQEHWDDVVANQVATNVEYTGPISLAGEAVTLASGVVKFDANDVVINQDAGGFTDGLYIVLMKWGGTAATSPLIGYGELGTNKSIQSGSLTFQWNVANGVFTLT